ncbi:potassium channel family protein [Arthrobacter antioxidans]|uniref:potassium channel family protein n=1 Tax=Arthrobacter antioxidans TaxID=2895818 RepID=UPI00200039FD|nr:potassium channel family protein [Arthrobacter antioxidans]
MDFRDIVLTVIGAGLILLMATDVFHTLLYPHGAGPVCRMIMRALWLLSRRFAGRAVAVAAPVAMAAVIGAWASLAIMGWALLYLPHLPEGFVYADGVPHRGDLTEALYFSMVSLSTVGYGEIVPATPLLRFVTAAQAVTGFGLLTATVSWILQTYPALSRRRALAHDLNLFREAAGQQGLSALEPGHAAALLESFARSVATVSIDLLAFNETYYFHEAQRRGSLPATITYAQLLASEAQASTDPDLRFAGRMMHAALDDLADVLRGRFGHSGKTTSAVFESYETHHRHRRKPDATAA